MARANLVYQHLVDCLPEYVDAINTCLVLWGIRPGTLVQPLHYPSGRVKDIDGEALIEIVYEFPDVAIHLFDDDFGYDSYLVYNVSEENKVNQLPAVLGAEINKNSKNLNLLGSILGYHCPGDWDGRFLVAYSINNSGKPNPFFSYMCNKMDDETLNYLQNYGQEISDFLVSLNFSVELFVYDTALSKIKPTIAYHHRFLL